MCRHDGLGNVAIEETKYYCSEELIRAIERNRIEMEIAWLRAEDPARSLLTLIAKYLKSKAHLEN